MELPPRIPIFFNFSGNGGVERTIVSLAAAMARRGYPVDLLLPKAEGAHARAMPEGVNVVDLGTRHTYHSLGALVRYLRRERPPALLSAKARSNQVAILARRLAGGPTRVTVRFSTTITESLKGRSAFKRWAYCTPIRLTYPWADAWVAPSAGVADDGARVAGLERAAIHVIPNPVITPELADKAAEPVDHPWLDEGEKTPVIMGVGRLTDAKDFPTLLRAFARLRENRPARLLLLGEGKQEEPLRELAAELGIAADVDLPGFAANPYAWMARADAFALSSKVEGSPIVLTEALALGVPSVATDCRSGPREVLDARWLAPVGDDAALAERLAAILDAPPDPEALKASVAEYEADTSARRHLEVMGLE